MTDQQKTDALLAFFKALADENRLKIVGLLAQRPYSVEKLADALGIGVSTTSHHLSRLAKAGLVSAKVDGHFYVYSLHTDTLRSMAQELLHEESLPRFGAPQDGTPESSEEAFERKVLANFIDAEGRITAFPVQEKKFLVLLAHAAKAFVPGKRSPEKEVNEVLARFNEDTALLRRSLVDYHFMEREGGGGSYWRV